MIQVRPATVADASEWLRMRHALWPDDSDDHRREIDGFFEGDRHLPREVLVAIDAGGVPVGFVELSIRTIVDSCTSDRVGYLEGWYVDPQVRRQGIGAALVAAAERWAAQQGCREFASDALADNEISRAAHARLGFDETGSVRNFRKDLRPSDLGRSTRIVTCHRCGMSLPWDEGLEVLERVVLCPGCVGEIEATLALRRDAE
jgi:aminoglycoside 6'-N-acetyltransferase I